MQSCGVMPVYKWRSGVYTETAVYRDSFVKDKTGKIVPTANCYGSDW